MSQSQAKTDFNLGNDDVEWTKEDRNSAKDFIQCLYRENILNHSKELILTNLDIDPKLVALIKECYNIRKDDIFQAVLCEELHKGDKNIVENIDWKLKWVMGSSKLATLREPLVQVDLYCFKKINDNVRNAVNFEMNVDQVNKLIQDLEEAQELLN